MTHKAAALRRTSAIAVTAGLVVAGLTYPAAAVPSAEPLPSGHADLPIGRVTADDAKGLDAPRRVEAGKRQSYLLRLNVRATSKTYAAAGKGRAGRQAARQQLDRVEAAQEQVIADLPARTPVLYRTHALLSGVAVRTRAANLPKLEAIPGVSKVYPIVPKTRTLSTSIPLQGGPSAWQAAGTGAGVKIAIIDSGVDYTHADFSGEGTIEAFEAAQAIDDDSWTTDKVVDGYDFVGDAYDADFGDTPQPDPNPLDCGGHGTHVAGIAAGEGVTKDGKPYGGDYDESIDYTSLRIGPGMAPEAKLYAYKVFGCSGSTDVVTQAIDAAVDPNGDGSPDDRVDVINMSLGSDFGSPEEADAIASNAAVEAGVVVVASAGNGGDLTDIAGSPANATKAISVANSVDGQSILDGAQVSIDGTPKEFGVTRAVLFDWTGSKDLEGTVVAAPETNQTACQPFTDDEKAVIAGKVVLVKWTQAALECGSIGRGLNLRNGGAVGFILANSEETFDAGINGDSVIPGVLMVKSGADEIRAALQGGEPVVATGTEANSVVQEFPELANTVSASSSRGIHAEGNVKPDIAAVGDTVFSAAVGTGSQGISETGTSMAGPTVAGLAALVVEANDDWTPEQVKAAIMNTAVDLTNGGDGKGDRYAPVRVGAGRISALPAVTNDVVAKVAGDSGVVSVSFGPVEVDGPMTLSKTVEVTNTGDTAAEYATSYDPITEVAGVSFTASPASITVAAGATEEVTVTFEAESREALDNTVDPTVGRFSALGDPRTTLAEASGHLLLTPLAGDQLRVPVYAAPRPVSELTGGTQAVIDPLTGKGQITLSGPGLGFGENGTEDADPDNDITSVGAALELSALDPAEPECVTPGDALCWTLPRDRAADVRRVGVTTDEDMAYFAVTADEPWARPANVLEYDVLIDVDGDKLEDFIAYTTNFTDTDTFVSALYDLNENEVVSVDYLNGVSGLVDTALYDSDTMLLPVWLEPLQDAGVGVGNSRVNYGLVTYSASSFDPVDEVGLDPDTGELTLSVDLLTPGLQTVDENGDALYFETGGTTLDVTRNADVYKDNKSLGQMLVHLHNAVGGKSEILEVRDAPTATTTTLTPAATSVEAGKSVDLKVAVAGAQGTPTGKVQVVVAGTDTVLAEGTLDKGGVTLAYTPTAAGTVRMVARYLGDPANQPSNSGEAVLTVTAPPTPNPTPTTPTPTPTPEPPATKKKQRLAASLPGRIKLSGLTLITAANTRTSAGQPVRTQVSGQSRAAGETRSFVVVRGKNGKVSIRTFGKRDLRIKVVQRAAGTDGFRPFKRTALYVDGDRK